MVSYQIFYTKKALEDIPKLKSAKLDTKAKNLISLIKCNPYQTPPPYEKLKGILQGAYSRRINIKHRLVYEVLEESKAIKSSAYGLTTNSNSPIFKTKNVLFY